MVSTDTRAKDTYSTLYATFIAIVGNFTLTFDSRLIVIAIGAAVVFPKSGGQVTGGQVTGGQVSGSGLGVV